MYENIIPSDYCTEYPSAISLKWLCIHTHTRTCRMQLFDLHSQMGFVAMLVARFYFAHIAVHHALLPSVTSNIVRYLAVNANVLLVF